MSGDQKQMKIISIDKAPHEILFSARRVKAGKNRRQAALGQTPRVAEWPSVRASVNPRQGNAGGTLSTRQVGRPRGGAKESDAKLSYFSNEARLVRRTASCAAARFRVLRAGRFRRGRELNCAPVPEEQTHSKFL